MRVVVWCLLGILAACRTSGSTTPKHPPVELPVVVEEDRFYLKAKTASGGELRVFLDSAGSVVLTKQAVERLRLPVRRVQTPEGERETAPFPTFYDARVPRPQLEAVPVRAEPLENADGILGALWFAGRVFTFDYAGKRLWLRAPGDVPQVSAAHRIPLGLRRDEAGRPESPFGRIQVEIDGATIDMLFDTGATVTLTDAAKQALGGAARERATSFITDAIFARWRAAHPEWRVIEAADRATAGEPLGDPTGLRPAPRAEPAGSPPPRFAPLGDPTGLRPTPRAEPVGSAPLIEVPVVRIAGHEVGPVWFTRRPDQVFRRDAARFMDRPADGAIGGSALRHFQRVTVDWVNATAVFER